MGVALLTLSFTAFSLFGLLLFFLANTQHIVHFINVGLSVFLFFFYPFSILLGLLTFSLFSEALGESIPDFIKKLKGKIKKS